MQKRTRNCLFIYITLHAKSLSNYWKENQEVLIKAKSYESFFSFFSLSPAAVAVGSLGPAEG